MSRNLTVMEILHISVRVNSPRRIPRELSDGKTRHPAKYSTSRLTPVTSRDSPADLRVIKTLRERGAYVDLAFFLGGVDKGSVMEALNPYIFFGDQEVHVEATAGQVPTGKVLYLGDSFLRNLQED